MVQLTLDGGMASLYGSNVLQRSLQNISLRFEFKSLGWSQFCDSLLADIYCIITQVNKHVVKEHGNAGLKADPLVLENWQWSLGHSHHSPLEVLKRTCRIREGKRVGWKKFTLEGMPFDPPFYS
jgi:hypothetical protein